MVDTTKVEGAELPELAVSPPEEADFEKEANEVRALLEEEASRPDRSSTRPYIDHLDDAVVDGVFLPEPGERVIIERSIELQRGMEWLDTREYEVRRIDPETGDLRLYDPVGRQAAGSNYLKGLERGYRFKLPARGTRLHGRGASKPKKKTQAPKKAPAPRGAPGLRRIYLVRGVICTRLKNVAYVAPEGTKAVPGERLAVSAPEAGEVTVSHPSGWAERWKEEPGM